MSTSVHFSRTQMREIFDVKCISHFSLKCQGLFPWKPGMHVTIPLYTEQTTKAKRPKPLGILREMGDECRRVRGHMGWEGMEKGEKKCKWRRKVRTCG